MSHALATAILTKKPVRLLLVENDPADAAFFEEMLQKGSGFAFAVSRAESLDAAQRAVAKAPFDVIVLDLNLPDSQGLDTLTRFRVDVTDSVPIFVLTGVDDDTDFDEIVFRSGNEYLIKSRLDHSLLPRLLRQAIERQRTQISMRRLITTNPDGIIVVDFDGLVLFANAMAAEFFKRTPEDLVGDSFGYPVIGGKSADISTLTNRFAEMRAVEIDWNGLPAFLVSLRDVTERLAMVRDLRIAKEQAELANRVCDEILANMNHEVRTPLNSIIGFSDLLLTGDRTDTDPETVRSYLGNINQSGWQLLELLNDVLDMANIRSNHFELDETIFDLGRSVDTVVQLMRSQVVRSGLTLDILLPPAPPRLHADQRRVKQMLGHLLSNAVKFNRRGGSIWLVVSTNDRNDLLLTVTDTGVGMEPERIATAEAAFGKLDGSYTCATRGAGLGLSLTKGMAERHGGRLLIKSTPGVGSSVTIFLPAFRVIQGDLTR